MVAVDGLELHDHLRALEHVLLLHLVEHLVVGVVQQRNEHVEDQHVGQHDPRDVQHARHPLGAIQPERVRVEAVADGHQACAQRRAPNHAQACDTETEQHAIGERQARARGKKRARDAIEGGRVGVRSVARVAVAQRDLRARERRRFSCSSRGHGRRRRGALTSESLQAVVDMSRWKASAKPIMMVQ